MEEYEIAITFGQLIITTIATTLTAIGASSGFWLYLDRRRSKRQLTNDLLIGIAHERLVVLAMKYINRGFITQDEHESIDLLFKPYKELGGNGAVFRLMKEVNDLKIFPKEHHMERKLDEHIR